MKFLRNKMVVSFCVLAAVFALLKTMPASAMDEPQGVFLSDLNAKYEQYKKDKNFTTLFDYLNALKFQAQTDEDNLQLDYYTAMGKSAYLDHLEASENWEVFYDKSEEFNEEIIDLAQKHALTRTSSGAVIGLQYLAWKANLRNDNTIDAEHYFGQLVDAVIVYTEKSLDTKKFQEVVGLIAKEGKIALVNNLFKAFREYLLKNDASSAAIEKMADMADDYLAKNEIDTACAIYGNYVDIALVKYKDDQLKAALKKAAEKFRHQGFALGKNAEFAEEVYAAFVKAGGENSLSPEDLFARAFNLEVMGDNTRAAEEYERFLRLYPENAFAPEVTVRLAIINLYFNKDKAAARKLFSRVIEQYADSFYSVYCKYMMAILFQLDAENEPARELYEQLISGGTEYADFARKRLEEINSESQIAEDVRSFFEYIFSKEPESAISMSLVAEPARSFAGSEVYWQATALDFSAGTIQPYFQFDWMGDLGATGNPGNVTEFSTAYDTASPKIAGLLAKVNDSENFICGKVWVHNIVIKAVSAAKSFKLGMPLKLTAELVPAVMDEAELIWKWQVSGPETFAEEGKTLNHRFQKPGLYEAEVMVSAGELQGKKKFAFEIVE